MTDPQNTASSDVTPRSRPKARRTDFAEEVESGLVDAFDLPPYVLLLIGLIVSLLTAALIAGAHFEARTMVAPPRMGALTCAYQNQQHFGAL